jgi:hypothetical protein
MPRPLPEAIDSVRNRRATKARRFPQERSLPILKPLRGQHGIRPVAPAMVALVTKGAIADPRAFLHPCPHMSFMWGDQNVAFLRERYKEMSAHHCYRGMQYSEDHSQIAEWVPLVTEGREVKQPPSPLLGSSPARTSITARSRTCWSPSSTRNRASPSSTSIALRISSAPMTAAGA